MLAVLAWLVCAPVALGLDVAVIGVHDASDGAAALDAAVRDRLIFDDRVTVLDEAAVRKRLGVKVDAALRDALLSEGRRLLDEGRALYQQAQPDAAMPLLQDAVISLADAVAATGSVDELWQAWMMLASARLAEGDEPGARDAVIAAAALQASRRPDPTSYPPDVVALHAEERDILVDEAVVLRVTTDVPQATLFLDGREVGVSPLDVDAVLPGQHMLVARVSDGRRAAVQLEVEAGSQIEIHLDLDVPRLGPVAESTSGRTRQVASVYRALARWAELDAVMILGRVDELLHVQVYLRSADAFSEPIVLSAASDADDLADSASRITREIASEGDLARAGLALPVDVSTNAVLGRLLLTPLPPERQRDDAEGKRVKWPVWVGVGAGGAAAVITAAVLAATLGGGGEAGPDPVPRGTITVRPPARR